MTTDEYLRAILANQTLDSESDEIKALRSHREDVEQLLRDEFAESSPTIRYAGSYAKETMIKESFDLDITCYFQCNDDAPGSSLEDVFNNVKSVLETKYRVIAKTSALRIQSAEQETLGVDFHIDVVPGRFTDDTKQDAYIFVASADKCRQKTNLQIHIDYIKGSDRINEIRLVKLWKVRGGIHVRTFVLELLVIKILKDAEIDGLDASVTAVFEYLCDKSDSLSVEDPANPNGNDLSEALNESVRAQLKSFATETLRMIKDHGWEAVFGPIAQPSKDERLSALLEVAALVPAAAKPWCETK